MPEAATADSFTWLELRIWPLAGLEAEMRSFCCYGVVKGLIPRELELHEAVWLIELNVAW